MNKNINETLAHRVALETQTTVSDGASVLRFRFVHGDEFHFAPGQYVWLVLDELAYPDPRGERRALSVISSNQDTSTIELLIRHSASGYKKTALELKPDAQATILGPFGQAFVLKPDNTDDITYIAGGVAVAPFLGTVNSFIAPPPFRLRMLHFFSDRTKSCEVSRLSKNLEKYQIDVLNVQGPFNKNVLPKNINYAREQFYVTGPQGFVNAVGAFLDTKKVPKDHRHFEEFYPEPPGNLTKEMIDSEQSSIMTQAIRDSRGHTTITDANGQILFANPKAQELTGYTLDEMRGSTPRLWGGIMPQTFYGEFWKRKHQEHGFDGELTNRRKNGDIYTVIAHISPITSKDGTVIGYVGTEEDVTERKAQEQLLKNRNQKLKQAQTAMLNVLEDLNTEKIRLAEAKAKDDAILSEIADGLVVTDKHGSITLINQAFTELLGWSEEEAVGKKLSELIFMFDKNGEQVPEKQRLITLTLSEKRLFVSDSVKGALQYQKKDGGKLPVNISVAPVVVNGEIIGAVEIFRDITKEREVDQAKTEFVSLASHQLRTPLSSVNWYAEMLLSGDAGALNDDQKKYIDEIYTGNQRMVALVNSLLNVSRLELGTFIVEPEPTDIVALARSVVEEQKPQSSKKEQIVKTKFAKDIPVMNADPKLVRMVFQNLLSNAIKYTDPKGTIQVTIAQKANNILINVTDNGWGIPKNQQNKIFTKLFRADNVKEQDTEGTGLGLYIVKSIIEHSGGTITFTSEEKKGTTFSVTLPLTGMQKKTGTKTLDE